jgi:myosin heavy chain 6/7
MQASLEAEQNGKAEALRMKKKLEGDINELEIALDHCNKVFKKSFSKRSFKTFK